MKWEIVPVKHRGLNRLLLRFNYSKKLNEEARKLPGVLWSSSLKAWHLADTPENREKYGIEEQLPVLTPQEDSDEIQAKLKTFGNWLRSRRYSESTVITYSDALKSFLRYYSGKRVEELNNDDLVHYNNDFILKKKLSASYQNQVVNAIKLFFSAIEHTSFNLDLIHRPKRAGILPKILAPEEVEDLINATKNLKHKSMFSLIYSAGLRRSELLNMTLKDIDSKRMLIHIRQAKGRKDRIAPLSQIILDLLRSYYKAYKPKEFLFEGQKGERYSERSLALALKKWCRLAGIKKKVNLHMLRHSYATHLLENGTDLRYIQELLGHKSSRTTEIYTHVSSNAISRIVSPFDKLNIK